MPDSSPTEGYTSARLELQRVATHILARARFAADGRFGLRVTFSGIATPAFGPDGQVLRILGTTLVRERRLAEGARSGVMAIPGSSLRALAEFAEVDLGQAFNAGTDTSPAGDIDAPIELGDPALEVLTWMGTGVEALDGVLPSTSEPSIIQLWPEHFDVAFDAATPHGRVNFGVSPGDSGEPRPYVYVGPWGADRPGDQYYWNAPFGATMTRAQLLETGDPRKAAVEFFEKGLQLLS